MQPLSEWYRLGDLQLLEWLQNPPPQLTRRLRARLISASAHCRVFYIHALVAEHGEEEAFRILEQEAQKPTTTKLKLLR